MADEKTVVKGKENKVGFFTKVKNFFKKLPSAIARPFKNMWHELRKVTWPSRPDVIKYSLIVLVFLVFMGVVIALLDAGSLKLVSAISPDKTKAQKQAEQEYEDSLPEGSVVTWENGYPVYVDLPDGYGFKPNGDWCELAEAGLPEGYTVDENDFIVLPEGYAFDAEGNVIDAPAPTEAPSTAEPTATAAPVATAAPATDAPQE